MLSVLGGKIGTAECLVKLLADDESRDVILDDDALFHALLERRGCLRVSTRFYFYILVRHVFRRADIQDRAVADYVAEVLSEFASADYSAHLLQSGASGQRTPVDYFFETFAALRGADDRADFFIRVRMGNWSLFLAGVFPDRIRFRAEVRGSPDLGYYEGIGRTQYRVASDHRLAQRYELSGILGTLAERFGATRLALNDIAERLFTIGDTGHLDALLRAAQQDPSGL